MKRSKRNHSRLFLVVACLSVGFALAGCDPNPGGLSDEQKLAGSKKARDQQMSQQAGNVPTNRNSMPGASNGQ